MISFRMQKLPEYPQNNDVFKNALKQCIEK